MVLKGSGQFLMISKRMSWRRNSDSRDEEIEDLKKIIGDQSLAIDAFKKRLQGRSK